MAWKYLIFPHKSTIWKNHIFMYIQLDFLLKNLIIIWWKFATQISQNFLYKLWCIKLWFCYILKLIVFPFIMQNFFPFQSIIFLNFPDNYFLPPELLKIFHKIYRYFMFFFVPRCLEYLLQFSMAWRLRLSLVVWGVVVSKKVLQ